MLRWCCANGKTLFFSKKGRHPTSTSPCSVKYVQSKNHIAYSQPETSLLRHKEEGRLCGHRSAGSGMWEWVWHVYACEYFRTLGACQHATSHKGLKTSIKKQGVTTASGNWINDWHPAIRSETRGEGRSVGQGEWRVVSSKVSVTSSFKKSKCNIIVCCRWSQPKCRPKAMPAGGDSSRARCVRPQNVLGTFPAPECSTPDVARCRKTRMRGEAAAAVQELVTQVKPAWACMQTWVGKA